MITKKYRIKYTDLYTDERKPPFDYIKGIPYKDLKKIVQFKYNYDGNFNIFSKEQNQKDFINRLESLLHRRKKENINLDNIAVMTPYSFLIFIELILSNKSNLNAKETNIDLFEEGVLKAFISINEELEEKEKNNEKSLTQLDSLPKFAHLLFTNLFAASDTEENRNIQELGKYIYCTIYKFQKLLDFLTKYEVEDFITYLVSRFKVNEKEELLSNLTTLLFNFWIAKYNNCSAIKVNSEFERNFIDVLTYENIKIEEDFRYLKENPLHKIEDGVYTYFDFLFVVDRFYKGIKFEFSKYYSENSLSSKFNNKVFLQFFGDYFSEKFLFRTICEQVFHKKYFYKLDKSNNEQDKKNEPDYYVRYNNDIFLFECKDTMIKGNIKASNNTETILNEFKIKFLENEKGESKGIRQLSEHIEKIFNTNNEKSKNFKFDDYVLKKNSFKVYPILVLCERIYDIHGLNFILNEWFKKEIESKFKEKLPKFRHRIKDLIIIDIDTFICLENHFKEKDSNFKSLLDAYLLEANKKYSENHTPDEKNKKLTKKLQPFSWTKPDFDLSKEIKTLSEKILTH